MSKTTRRLKPFTAFQSIAVTLAQPRAGDTVDKVLRDILGPDRWVTTPLLRHTHTFEARQTRLSGRNMNERIAAAWDSVYALRSDPRILSAEPLFATALAESTGRDCYQDDPATNDDCDWSLDAMEVKQAWQMFTSGPGEGVRVAHPDTGYTEHFEIFGARLLDEEGHNFEEEDKEDDPHDTLASGGSRVPGHGTRTASVIMSGPGRDVPSVPEAPFVSGVAPAASLIPIRTTKVAAIFNPTNLIRAIEFATSLPDVHVLSISLGGPFKPRALHDAVRAAVEQGIIVLCGAGNKFGPILSVSYPAAFDEAIAVAASTFDKTPWPCSCRGPAVDVTAPGHSVWSARTTKTKNGFRFDVDRDSGTSFAVAGIAGIAALWLSFHGRKTLLGKYGPVGLSTVFKQLLQDSCSVPPGWQTDTFGAGIANARQLLEMPLPPVAMSWFRADGRKPASIDSDDLEALVHLAYPAPRSGIAWMMARVLGVTEPMLPAALRVFGDEIVYHAATNMSVLRALQDGSQAAVEPAHARNTGRARDEWVAVIRRLLRGPSASRHLRDVLSTRGRTAR